MIPEKVYELIKEEITNDPEKRGYKGKTDTEIMVLLNENYTVDRIVTDLLPSRIHVILRGIADMPNVLSDSKDVTEAKKVILEKEIL
jgi:hypothetical protein